MRFLLPMSAVAAATAALVLGACGETQTLCVIQDVTNPSTAEIYAAELRDVLRGAAANGQDVKALPFAGAARTESVPVSIDLAGLDEDEQRSAIRRGLRQIEAQALELQSRGGTKRDEGSGILDALAKAVEGSGCAAGVVALTDGLERHAFDVYKDDFVSRKGRAKLVDELQRAGMIPDLKGVTVTMPYGGVVPSGSVIAKDKRRVAAMEELYDAIVQAGGGTLAWGT